MIHTVDMYAMTCDKCGDALGAYSEYSAWAETSSLEDDAENHDWAEKDGKHYCPKCYRYDNDKLVVIKKEEK